MQLTVGCPYPTLRLKSCSDAGLPQTQFGSAFAVFAVIVSYLSAALLRQGEAWCLAIGFLLFFVPIAYVACA